MPRIARAVAVGFPHHVIQRGNYRQAVFQSDEDYLQYIEWLRQYSKKYGMKVWAYCLMSNHVHFIAVPMEGDSFARTFNTLHMRYSQYANMRQDNRGHLWQGRFFSCALDERHLYAGVRYVENNPVKARIVRKAEHYRWSSARAHVSGKMDTVLAEDCYLVNEIEDWSGYLREKEDTVLLEDIRQGTRTGRPCGDDRFMTRLEHLLGRRLTALPRGRPRKSQ
jgi:putative transposase